MRSGDAGAKGGRRSKGTLPRPTCAASKESVISDGRRERVLPLPPVPDGNGRIGRLLIALLLEHWGLLKAPLLYLSLFFKRHRAEYYRRLDLVRLEGDWEGWTDFFLDGVATISDEAVASARELFNLVGADRARLLAAESASVSVSALRLFERLPRHPIVTVGSAMKLIDASKPTAIRAIDAMTAIGILVETTGRKRDRSFAYRAYMDRLRTGTELTRRG